MALNALSLTGTFGTVGRPFSAAIRGLTPGSQLEVLPDRTPGFIVVNGRVIFEKLPAPINNVALRETLVGVGVRDTRIAITAPNGQLKPNALSGPDFWQTRYTMMPDCWDFPARINPGELIATLVDPFLGTNENYDAPTVWTLEGAVPPQLAFVRQGVFPGVDAAIVAGASPPVAGTTYSISIRATSGVGGGATKTFIAANTPALTNYGIPFAAVGTLAATLPFVCL